MEIKLKAWGRKIGEDSYKALSSITKALSLKRNPKESVLHEESFCEHLLKTGHSITFITVAIDWQYFDLSLPASS